MLHTVIAIGDIFPEGNIPTLDGIYVNAECSGKISEQQIMSTNPRDFLNSIQLPKRED